MRTWESFIREQTNGAATRVYRIGWDNGHACGLLAEMFDTKRAATVAGREWKRGMVALESTAKDRREAQRAYSYEIIEGWCVDGDWVADGPDAES